MTIAFTTHLQRNSMSNQLRHVLVVAIVAALPCLVSAQSAAPAIHSATPAQVQPWTKIPIPPLHAFKPQEPRRIELANGLVIFLQEDHELPFINGSILIRGGSRDEPAAKVGLVSLYGQTWRTSGSTTATGDDLDNQLAAKAASIETGGGQGVTSLHWSSLKGDFDPVFASSIDLLLHPAFKEQKLQLAQRQAAASISRRNDSAPGIAARVAIQLVYGADNPYGRISQYSTVDAVTLADLEAWHKRTVVPNNMMVAVSGDFDSAKMEAKLRSVFEPMQPGVRIPALKLDFPGPKPGVYFVDKPDVDQSTVYTVGIGTEQSNPDYYALSVMNEVFSGGDFGSRIFNYVRTKLGLAYEVGGAFSADFDHPGIFYGVAATKSASTVPATQAVLHEIALLKTDPPTPAEMKRAKDDLLNSFIFNYDTPEKTLSQQITLAFYNYPPDFLEKYKDGIERITSPDVTRVANKYIDVSKLAIVVVGNASEITPSLSTLGPVTNVDIAIPPPPGAKSSTPAAH
jgi:zinc protease